MDVVYKRREARVGLQIEGPDRAAQECVASHTFVMHACMKLLPTGKSSTGKYFFEGGKSSTQVLTAC